jgi:hypothetical protein
LVPFVFHLKGCLLSPVDDAIVAITFHAVLAIALKVCFPLPPLAVSVNELVGTLMADWQNTSMFVVWPSIAE